MLWWCTNGVTAYSYITACFYIPFSVFIVMSVVPITQVIAPHITVILVVNPILNYPNLPPVTVLKCHILLGSETTTFCSLISYQWLQCCGSSYSVTAQGKLWASSLCDKAAPSLQMAALTFPTIPAVLLWPNLYTLTGVQDTETDLITVAFYETVFNISRTDLNWVKLL